MSDTSRNRGEHGNQADYSGADADVQTALVARLMSEQRITMSRLARLAGVDITTANRWVHRGVGGVKLEFMKIGGRLETTVEAYHRFVARRSQPQRANTAKPANGRGSESIRQAEDLLEGEGL